MRVDEAEVLVCCYEVLFRVTSEPRPDLFGTVARKHSKRKGGFNLIAAPGRMNTQVIKMTYHTSTGRAFRQRGLGL